ncbi:MAG: glutamate--tRNA ligase family protein, partial [Anaerolineales bacterium]|nr:glutamate--tRNA ligase family protein [Anaerolineales bacterium]
MAAKQGRPQSEEKREPKSDFVRAAVSEDARAGKFDRRVQTRFPPEPNGYLHIGHAKY